MYIYIYIYIYVLSGNKRSYILQETKVFSCGFLVAFTSGQRVNNFCILTLCVFQILMYVFFVVIAVSVLCTCRGYYPFYERIL